MEPPPRRLRIDPHWENKWKSIRKTNLEFVKRRLAEELIPALEHYVSTGEGMRPIVDGVQVQDIRPDHDDIVMKWEQYLAMDLLAYAHARQLEFEVEAIERHFDEILAMHAFAGAYTAQMINVHIHSRFPLRFGGRRLRSMDIPSVPFTVMGMLLGAPQAADLARIQIAAYRRGDYSNPGAYPIYEFVLSLLCEYLDERPLGPSDNARIGEPILQDLLRKWRNHDPQALVEVFVAAADFHTHRCRTGKGRQYYEFESYQWTRTPFEILLVMKLRQKLGLQNPDLDHPLMNTALGVLPNEVPFAPDDLIARVRARMMQDGYDEQAIYRAVLADT